MHIGWELRSSLVGDTILGVQSEPACIPRLLAVVVSLKHYATPALVYILDKTVNTAVCTGTRYVKTNSTYISNDFTGRR